MCVLRMDHPLFRGRDYVFTNWEQIFLSHKEHFITSTIPLLKVSDDIFSGIKLEVMNVALC